MFLPSATAFLRHLKAGSSIAEWRIFGQFAATDMHWVAFLIQRKLERLERRSEVTGVAERLFLWHSTWTPKVIFRSKHHILHLVRPDFRGNGEGFLCCGESPLELSSLVFLNSHSWVVLQIWMEVLLGQIRVPLFHGLSHLLESTVHVVNVGGVSV